MLSSISSLGVTKSIIGWWTSHMCLQLSSDRPLTQMAFQSPHITLGNMAKPVFFFFFVKPFLMVMKKWTLCMRGIWVSRYLDLPLQCIVVIGLESWRPEWAATFSGLIYLVLLANIFELKACVWLREIFQNMPQVFNWEHHEMAYSSWFIFCFSSWSTQESKISTSVLFFFRVDVWFPV